jgi:DNA polymerase III alpha subunit (gram-positive type)
VVNKPLVFDIEADGLYDEATKIYCMSYETPSGAILSATGYNTMVDILRSSPSVVGHNISQYDLGLIEKLTGFKYEGLVIDTLFLSWYLDPNRPKHRLEDYGVEFGYPKVVVNEEEWQEGNLDLMIERCERDVEINVKVWQKQRAILEELYG